MRTFLPIALLGAAIFSQSFAQGAYSGYDFSVAIRNISPEIHTREHTRPIVVPLPTYPPEMLRARIAGDVTLRFLVGVDGVVGTVEVVAASQVEFCPAAKEAIKRWTFQSYTERGVPVAKKVWMRCKVIFRCEED